MNAPFKFTTFFGMLAKPESSYGAGATLATGTDGVLLEEWGTVQPQYANLGMRSMAAWYAGYQRKVAASAGFVKVGAKVVMRGGQAYGTSTPQSSLRTLLRMSGFDVAVTTTPGAEKEVYTPTPSNTGYASGGLELYGRGEKAILSGALADFSVGVTGPDVPVWQFDIDAILGTITDVTLPSISYPNFDPPKAVNIAFTGSPFANPVIRGFNFKWGRKTQPRLDINPATPHAGFGPIRRTPELELTIETPPIPTWDIVGAFVGAFQYANPWLITVGSAAYSRFKLGGSFLQLIKPPEPLDDGGIATTKLTFQCNPDAIGSTNDITITLD